MEKIICCNSPIPLIKDWYYAFYVIYLVSRWCHSNLLFLLKLKFFNWHASPIKLDPSAVIGFLYWNPNFLSIVIRASAMFFRNSDRFLGGNVVIFYQIFKRTFRTNIHSRCKSVFVSHFIFTGLYLFKSKTSNNFIFLNRTK